MNECKLAATTETMVSAPPSSDSFLTSFYKLCDDDASLRITAADRIVSHLRATQQPEEDLRRQSDLGGQLCFTDSRLASLLEAQRQERDQTQPKQREDRVPGAESRRNRLGSAASAGDPAG